MLARINNFAKESQTWESILKEKGFIHLYPEKLVPYIMKTHMKINKAKIMLIDEKQLNQNKIKWEIASDGLYYPHYFDIIPKNAIYDEKIIELGEEYTDELSCLLSKKNIISLIKESTGETDAFVITDNTPIKTIHTEKLYELFDDFVRKNAYKNKNEKWIIDQYWDRSDSITDIMNEIFRKPKTYLKENKLQDHVFEKLYERDSSIFETLEPHLYITKVIRKLEEDGIQYDKNQIATLLEEYFYNNYECNANINELINYTEPDDLVLYFGTNWDDDYMSHTAWLAIVNEDVLLTKSLIEEANTTALGWLVKSQGYTPEDIKNAKTSNSNFVKTVYEEITEYIGNLAGCQLIAIPNSKNWNAIFELKTQKSGIIKKGTKFGLFNRIHGSGSGLEITIEKDIILKDEPILYSVEIETQDRSYWYSPRAVYGQFNRSNEEQLESEVR